MGEAYELRCEAVIFNKAEDKWGISVSANPPSTAEVPPSMHAYVLGRVAAALAGAYEHPYPTGDGSAESVAVVVEVRVDRRGASAACQTSGPLSLLSRAAFDGVVTAVVSHLDGAYRRRAAADPAALETLMRRGRSLPPGCN